ncbi:histidinol dehydrogenase [Anaerocolumna xylanovorans DSM 12503]|uniref:Histidinol dehydrogenase n=2 Tax=Anaerocolumna TaxID=1843210 RepID=A0A1M7YAZ0_9FIRM|nr:histidinol dehydrogenase [Anaerocolumna xylanovorans DSM 12503]
MTQGKIQEQRIKLIFGKEVMMRIERLEKGIKEDILRNLLKRSPNQYETYEKAVAEIIEGVKVRKDAALFEYTKRFDKADINRDTILVTKEEMEEAYNLVDPEVVQVIRKSAENIRTYHEKQKQYSWFDSEPSGIILGQKITPLASVGVYVPGGKAAYPSSVLMNVIPAKVAGVKRIAMTTPPDSEGKVYAGTLVAAKEAGITEIYKVGGAQAIAALAHGTESIKKVDKIVGPGNIYVALAKKAVYGHVSIDSIAGPSEILVLADETANPRYVAADLLSQAEHDELASAILITTSEELAYRVSEEVKKFTSVLSRKEIIEKSLDNYGYILIASDMDEAVETANEIASEHLEILTKDPFTLMTKIQNAGAIFLGEYSSEPLGDYFAGPNHVLPTNGTAKFFSPLSVDDYIKKSSIISYSREALEPVYKDIVRFAQAEGLTAHANSIAVRFEEE